MFTFDANNNLNVNSVAPATQPVSGTVTANQGTAKTAANVSATQATAANLNATVVGTTLTKGTQGAAGFTVQELKDAGRNTVSFFTVLPIITTAAEALLSLTGFKS